jgi:DNA polymerase III delta prime subunit
MNWFHTPVELAHIQEVMQRYPSLIRALKKDWTQIVRDDLHYRLHGRIPRNWVLNIRGLIGTPTGIFKTSMGLCFARELDPTFNVAERVAFTPADLNNKVKQFADRKQIFFMDEQIHDLKESQMLKLQNTIESCREKQMCFILCGVPKEYKTFSTYLLERFDETTDEILPRKSVRYLVRNPETDEFRGVITKEIPVLNNQDGSLTDWGVFWAEYMELKTAHQNKILHSDSLTGFDYEGKAKELLEEGYDQYLKVTKSGVNRLDMSLLGMAARKKFADFTQQEKQDIIKCASVMINKEI